MPLTHCPKAVTTALEYLEPSRFHWGAGKVSEQSLIDPPLGLHPHEG